MNQMHGNEATCKIREFEDQMGIKPIPIIGLSASANPAAATMGMNICIPKPICKASLSNAILSCLVNDDRECDENKFERHCDPLLSPPDLAITTLDSPNAIL